MNQFPKGVKIVEGSSFDNWNKKNTMKTQYRALYIVGAIAVVAKMIINVSDTEVLASAGLLLAMCGATLVGIAVCIIRNIFKLENK